jgi:hypothetical protein
MASQRSEPAGSMVAPGEHNTTSGLEENKVVRESPAVRFISVNEEIEPQKSLQSIDALPLPQQLSGEEQAKLQQLSKTLHGTYLQERRMSHFAFEPVSLPASRVCTLFNIYNLSGPLACSPMVMEPMDRYNGIWHVQHEKPMIENNIEHCV